MTPTMRAVVLLAHGSRDPSWSQPIEAVAARMRAIDPAVAVRCAYMELMNPDLQATADELARAGMNSITIVPMFLGMGQHARVDLPRLIATLQNTHPQITLRLHAAIGEQPRVLDLMAEIALS